MTDTIERFLSTTQDFIAQVQDLPEHLLDCSAAPGEWTVRQIIHHVADDGDMWSLGLKKAIAAPGALLRFEGFPGNEVWAAALAFNRRPVGPVLALLTAHRQIMAELARAVISDEGKYVAIVDENGKLWRNITVAEILEMLSGHVEGHTETVRQIRAQFA